MEIRRFSPEKDREELESYLREQYIENGCADPWLPERLHDLLFRCSALEEGEGNERSMDYIFLWEEDGAVAACLLPDGENVYVSAKRGKEQLFAQMLAFAETNCLPLFRRGEDGSVKFWMAVDESRTQWLEELEHAGYARCPETEDWNVLCPAEAKTAFCLPVWRGSSG